MVKGFLKILIAHKAPQDFHVLVRGARKSIGNKPDRVGQGFAWRLEPYETCRQGFCLRREGNGVHGNNPFVVPAGGSRDTMTGN